VNDIYTNTLGEQLRFLFSPRITAVAEIRGSVATLPNSQSLNSSSQFLLLGADATFSPRLHTDVRFGEEVRQFQSGGQSAQASPYLESTISYVYGHQSTLSLTNRFGLDQSNTASSKVVSFRTGIGVNHVISARTTGSIGLNYNRVSTTEPTTNLTTDENDVSFTLGLQYVVNRHLTLNASYSFVETFSSNGFSDYIRNQIFIGGQYSF
jgi:hypothetical protein